MITNITAVITNSAGGINIPLKFDSISPNYPFEQQLRAANPVTLLKDGEIVNVAVTVTINGEQETINLTKKVAATR